MHIHGASSHDHQNFLLLVILLPVILVPIINTA
jgi:hypothetical protein